VGQPVVIALALAAHAQQALQPGEIVVDRPTVVSLGVQWLIAGDADHDASVTVRYREQGGSTWYDGMPLFRVYPADVADRTVPQQFAGSLFDLRPDTTYEIELQAADPDGGDALETVTAATRPVPGDPANPHAVAVANANQLQNALDAASPGDVITLAAGTYAGPFEMQADGTAARPIVIRGAATDTVMLDGGGCGSCNVLEIYGSYVHLEQVTLQNANRALRFQGEGAVGNVVRYVHIHDVGLGIASNPDQLDFYLCDNDLEGPLAWPHVYTDDGGQYANVDGINIQGSGHVVCHNRLIGWGDAMKVEQDGARAIDFYGNDVLSAYDNALEFDTSEGNVRAFRNRFTNTYATISFQPVFGGPVYALRNVIVNIAHENLKCHNETSGLVIVHNTFVHPGIALNLEDGTTSHHLLVADNLFVGPAQLDGNRVANWSGGLDDATFDANGWYPDGRFDFGDAGDWPSFAAMQAAGVFEAHGTLLDVDTFASGLVAPADYTTTMAPQDVRLAAGSPAVDAGIVLPGIDDGYAGTAPDLGAVELGCAEPAYGPRPDGVDEGTADDGCGGSGPGDTDVVEDTDVVGDTDAGDTDLGGDSDAGDTDPHQRIDDDPHKCGCNAGSRSAGGVVILVLLALRRTPGRLPAPAARPGRSRARAPGPGPRTPR
jgi:hypothetical protein